MDTPVPPPISIHDADAVRAEARRLRVDQHRVRLLRNAFYKRQADFAEALTELDEGDRPGFATAIRPHALDVVARHDSAIDGASKLALRTAAGLLIETVILRIASGRTSVCVSSQVGCAAGCRFCATAMMGVARSLTADEILDQVVRANQILRAEGRQVRNVVFMGMGEPLHNEEQVARALEVLQSPACFNLTPSRLLVSTVGVPEVMRRFARRFPEVGLALSLHSARQEVRERIIPLARKHQLDDLRSALAEAAGAARLPVMIEYLLLDGVNDGDGDVAALVDYLSGLPVHVNLIPYNQTAEGGFRPTPAERRRRFAAVLRGAGFRVTLRYSLGADIAAACGQLVRAENREAVRSATHPARLSLV